MDMNYEIVTLPEQTVVGLSARMRNDDPACGAVIGGLWQKLFETGLYFSIPNKAGEQTIGMYDAYETDMTGPYDTTVGCAVTDPAGRPEGTVVKTIPAGKYAKFAFTGHVQEAVGAFWMEAWKLPLDRAYTADFECYSHAEGGEVCAIEVYLALK